MNTSPNQKRVVCNTWNGNAVPEEYQPYVVCSLPILSKAAHLLTPNAMLVYLCLSGNRNGYEIALSNKAICDWANISRPTYNRVVHELINKRFLCLRDGTKNVYDFYLLPDNDLSMEVSKTDNILEMSNNETDHDLPKTENEDKYHCLSVKKSNTETDMHHCLSVKKSNTETDMSQYFATNNTDIIYYNTDSIIDNNTIKTDKGELKISQTDESIFARKEKDNDNAIYSTIDLINALRATRSGYDYTIARDRVESTFNRDFFAEVPKWKILGYDSPEHLEKAVNAGREKYGQDDKLPF